MRFGSVCSGIEAASVAWEPLGWQAAWLAEIEPFPAAVLKYHYANVPNLGDMTRLPEMIRAGEVEAPDLFCGGTPCQAFSVAGLRKSLDDARGNLSLTFCEIANAIDTQRAGSAQPPAIIFWENVPGVLSTKDNAFGCFLAGLAGEENPVEPPRGKWTNAGVVLGPQRAVAWRILDAQYFGLAQRRRRVFVVASARDDFDPVSVLLEFDGVRRDSAPSRKAGKVASTIPSRSTAGGGLGTDFDCDGGVIQHCGHCKDFFAKYRCNAPDECDCPRCQGVCGCYANKLSTYCIKGAAIGRKPEAGPQHGEVLEEACYTLNCVDRHAVSVMSTGQANAEIRTDGGAPTLTCNHEAPIAAYPATTHTLRGEGFDASEDGAGRGTPLVPVVFSIMPMNSGKDYKAREVDVAQPLMAAGPVGGNQGGDFIAQPIAFDTTQITSPENGSNPKPGGPCHPLAAGAHAPAVAYSMRADHGVAQPVAFHPTQDPISSTDGSTHAMGCGSSQGCATVAVAFSRNDFGGDSQVDHTPTMRVAGNAGGMLAAVIPPAMQVRRLTPRECERLQGFPDDYTLVPHRGKLAADGPRYKALGNSWAVPVVRWIGRRIHNALVGGAA